MRLVEALAGIVRDAGGAVTTDADVERIVVANGRATGVRLAGGELVDRNPAVSRTSRRPSSTAACSRASEAPPRSRRPRERFRYGRAEMQIHLALDELPRWTGPEAERLGRCPIVHVTPGLDGVSRAVNEAERGLLPAEATIVCGQPVALDPSRAPGGQVDHLDPAAGASRRADQGRCRRRDRRRRRPVDGRRCARRTPTGSSPGSASRSRTSTRRR